MNGWLEERIHLLLSIDCENTFFQKISSIARDLGFDYCAYGMRMPLPVSQPKIRMFNNYSTDWRVRYQQKGYLSVDPTVRHGMRSLTPVVWSEELFSGTRELWEEAQAHGLSVGWAQSSRDENGIGGMLTLARSHDPISDSELREKGVQMTWLAQTAHLGMSRCLVSKLLPEIDVKLTGREAAILRWTADGKTSGEISEILGIAERTVNFHINNAVSKLGTNNKLAAAVKATVLGLLH